ncbi:O-antigen ligase family protein [Taibaiella koreensis]|uniref:O-antigen ligase family protein n=1 Tax=Taibaiella koreensis TaxID=1268548 RepID=UPI000E59BB94|nr:O-antigen ligase family protein [Taibaiella koreensis]
MKHHYDQSVGRYKEIQDWIALFCCLAMIAGLFFSRALLSSAILVLWVSALHPAVIRDNWRALKRDRFSLLCFGFFGTYLLSGLWSDDTSFWLASIINKLPFVLLPFAFSSVALWQPRFLRWLVAGLVLMQLAVVGNSLLQLALDPDYYIRGYHFSRPLPTTRYNDHIRFSLTLVFSLLLLAWLMGKEHERPLGKTWRIVIFGVMAIFIVYIHILAAKTGLICLYLAFVGYALLKVFGRSKIKAFLLILGILALPLTAYFLVPTFKTKVDYVFYEIDKSRKEKKYDYTLSDAGRMITYELGRKAIARHPIMGVGAGDIMDEMKHGYREYYPEVSPDQQYGPINQYMFTALCVGLPLSLFLVGMSLAPFGYKGNGRMYLGLTCLILIVSIMVEAMLEVQFGVFTYLFFLLLWINIIKNKSFAPSR